MSARVDSPVRRLGLRKRLVFSFVAALLIFFVFEGICSTVIVFRDVLQKPQIDERRHTEYDADLGWIHTPHTSIRDMYGPNRHLTINGQRFRSKQEFSRKVPDHRIRVICSGDSFTLGHTVDDDATWCARLETLEPRFQTINMGQGGYGIGQAWLWYEREKESFDHQVHILAFIAEDFRRISATTFVGYGKPVLKVHDGDIQVTNVPVPKTAYVGESLMRNAIHLQQLCSVRVMRRMISGAEHVPDEREVEETGLSVAAAVFRRLQAWHKAHNSTFVLVYLPVESEYRTPPNVYRTFVQELALKENQNFIDLALPINELEFADMTRLYEGHFNERGNQFVAEYLHRKLLEIPAIATALNQPSSD